MNFVTKKSFGMKLIIVIFLIVFLFNNVFVNYSYGADIGGILFKPISGVVGVVLLAVNGILGVVLSGVGDLWTQIMGTHDSGPNVTDSWRTLLVSPEYIFAGAYPLLDANIFNKDTNNTVFGQIANDIYNGAGASLSGSIKAGVSGVYYILRNTCVVALLSVLIYIGIRIILSSNSPHEQGRWKMYLIDWVKALALVLFVHVLMIGIFYIVDLVKEAFASSLLGKDGSIAARCAKDLTFANWDLSTQIISLIMFGYVTYLNIIFVIAYFKRLVWTVMLIIIAPVVAVVYPFSGKGFDGKGVFDRWLREFIMNAILPVYHIIIYYTLAVLPLNIAEQDPQGLTGLNNIFTTLYSLFSISMIRPAEKFFRKLFGIQGDIANQGTFDSGKKTFDAIGDIVKQIGALIAVAATGGAAAGAVGAAGAAGAGAGAASAGAAGAGIEGAAGAGALGIGEGEMPGMLSGELGESFEPDGVTEINGEQMSINQLGDENIDEVNYEDSDINSTKRIGNNNVEANENTNTEENGEDSTVVGLLTEIRDLLADGSLDENINGNEPIKFQDDEAASGDGDDGDDSEELNPKNIGDIGYGEKTKRQKVKDFLNKHVGQKAPVQEAKNLFGTSQGQEALMGLRDSLHGLTDTMYVDGTAPRDWNNDTVNKYLGEKVKKRGEAEQGAFINNQNHIDFVVHNHNDKLLNKWRAQYTDSKGYTNEARALAAAEKEAKTILERNASFANYGIKDIALIDKLGDYQKNTGLSTEDTIKTFVNTMKCTEKEMISRKEQIETNINGQVKVLNVSDIKGIGSGKIDPQEKEEIKKAIFDRASTAMDYQVRTGDINEKRSVNLAEIEKKLDDLGIKVSNTVNKQDVVIGIGDAVNKAIKETGGKPVTMDNAINNKSVEKLQDLINEEIQERKK